MLQRPDESEQVEIVIKKNLQPEYLDRLESPRVDSFLRLMKIGTRIKDNVRSGKIHRDTFVFRGKRPMYPNNPLHDVTALALMHAPQY